VWRSTLQVDERLARQWLRNMQTTGKPGEPDLWRKAAAQVITSSQGNARKHGRAHELNVYHVLALLRDQDYECAVSGISLEPTFGTNELWNPWSPSIDRIDNRKGYVPGNVRITCIAANLAMGRWGEEALAKLAKHVVAKRNKRAA